MAERPRIVIEFYGEQDVRFDAKVEGHLSPLQLYAAFSVLSSHFKQQAMERIFGNAIEKVNVDISDIGKLLKGGR